MARRSPTATLRSSGTKTTPATPPSSSAGPLIALAAGAIPALLLLAKAPGLNGTPYWPWRYIDAPAAPFLAIAGVAFAGAYAAAERFRATSAARLPLVGLALIHVALIFAFAAMTDQGLAVVGERVRHPDITSYHTEAARLDDLSDWLAHYDQRLPRMVGHTQTHPPGPVLYYVFWNRLFGPDAGADVGGLFLGLLAGLAIPLIYVAGTRAASEPQAGFAAALLWTPMPAAVMMLGSFDAVYPLFTLGLIALWIPAAWAGDLRAAAAFGGLLALALLFTHSFLVLGALFGAIGLAPVFGSGDRRAAGVRLARASLAALAVCIGLFVLAKLFLGYDHLAALKVSLRIQEGLAKAWDRPWRLTVIWDVYDYFLASGWAPAALVALLCIRWLRGGLADAERTHWFGVAALATLAIVDVSGLLRAETARVWLFLQPLALIVAGVELSRWPPGWRAALVGALFFALAVIRARLIFI